MYKIHQLFIVKFLLLFIGAFVIFSIIGYSSIKSIIIEENKNYLQKIILLSALDIDRVKNLELYAKNISNAAVLRVTMIKSDGEVLAESNFDIHAMQNHKDREEILQAQKQEFSSSIRFSQTLGIDFLYVAKKINYKDAKIYLRLATPLSGIMDSFYSLFFKLALAFLLILSIAFYIAKLMSDRVLYDLNQLKNYLEEISTKNYKAIMHVKYFHEFLELSLILKNIIKRLNKKEKKKK
ncbi:hypothetical protein GJV85_03120 [Sulfurimonas aquatica]|uniref:Uncharacterized protein n=1 Tax=Sulfurimonas aquatica TaxID=2672570 RepID=A0A975AZ17_9BACT|nr:hypothetical protein [Sulfurimonas aquatica]QSZ41143.1 hypothetical protein GJV85_03120 [Sulfurimonas aquatica]